MFTTKMKKPLIILILFLPNQLFATGYTLGSVSEWRDRLQSSIKYIEAESRGNELTLSKEIIGESQLVVGFLEGVRIGYFLDIAVQLKSNNDGAIPNNEPDPTQGICMEEPYFQIIPKLNSFLNQPIYNESEFLPVFLEFAESTYPCK